MEGLILQIINSIIKEMYSIQEQLIFLIFFVVVLLIAPLLLMGIDFWSGIRKAHIRKERITSDKMQRTVRKLSRYYSAILAMLVIDCVQIAGFLFLHIFNGWTLYTLPLFTLIAVGFVASIEIRSIWEPADAKEGKEMKEVTQLAQAIVEHRQDPKEIAEAIAEYLQQAKSNTSTE